MATPQSTASAGGEKKVEQITFRFCSECSNMLYPKEDEDSHKLQFTCRTCQYTEEANSTCVFRHLLNNAAGETAGVTQDVGSDPTVGDLSLKAPAGGAGPIVICLCCGKLVRCEICGVELALPTSDMLCAKLEILDTESDGATDYSGTAMDVDLDFDFAGFSCEYDVENDMECDNRDEDEEDAAF